MLLLCNYYVIIV